MTAQKETSQATEYSLLSIADYINGYLQKNTVIYSSAEIHDNRDKTRKIIGFLTTVIRMLAHNEPDLRPVKEDIEQLIGESRQLLEKDVAEAKNHELVSIYNNILSILNKICISISKAAINTPQHETSTQTVELHGAVFPDALMSILLRLFASDSAGSDRLIETLSESALAGREHAAQIAELHETIYELEMQALRDQLETAKETSQRRDGELNDVIYTQNREIAKNKAMLNTKLRAERRKARRELFKEMDIALVINQLEIHDLYIANLESESASLELDTQFVQILAMRAFAEKVSLAGKLKEKIRNLISSTTDRDTIDSLFDQAEKWIEVRSSQSDQ